MNDSVIREATSIVYLTRLRGMNRTRVSSFLQLLNKDTYAPAMTFNIGLLRPLMIRVRSIASPPWRSRINAYSTSILANFLLHVCNVSLCTLMSEGIWILSTWSHHRYSARNGPSGAESFRCCRLPSPPLRIVTTRVLPEKLI